MRSSKPHSLRWTHIHHLLPTLPDICPLLFLSVSFWRPANPLITPFHELTNTPIFLPTLLTFRTQFSHFSLINLSTPRTLFLPLPSLFFWFPIFFLSFHFLYLLYFFYVLYSIYSHDSLYSFSLSLYPTSPLSPCTSFNSLDFYDSLQMDER